MLNCYITIPEMTMNIVKPSVKLLACTPSPEKLIERAGRVCYKSEDKIMEGSSDNFVMAMVKHGHESVIEHASATMLIICDRGITHQIVRHRLASYSQESTRYCNYMKDKFGKNISVIEPPGLSDDQRAVWVKSVEHAEQAYHDLIESGVHPDFARAVLPTCTKTELVMTANFREWRWFIKQRLLNKHAHIQVQEVARMILDLLLKEAPHIFADLKEEAAKG